MDAVIAIAAEVHTAPHWPAHEFTRMLRVIRENPHRRGAWVAVRDPSSYPRPVHGFAMAMHVAGTAEVEAVVTSPHHRREGIGLALLEAVIAWSRSAGAERLLLEARVSNKAALCLYGKLGFQKDGIRRGYYRNPEEDAALLSLRLLNPSAA